MKLTILVHNILTHVKVKVIEGLFPEAVSETEFEEYSSAIDY